MSGEESRSGFVAVLGVPNAGKSSLVNALTGKKVSGVSAKPQTTRRPVLGVLDDESSQFVFIDTPGYSPSKHLLGGIMARSALSCARDADLVLYVVDASRPEERNNATRTVTSHSRPAVLALNKIDLVPKEDLLPLIKRFHEEGVFREIVPVSATTGDGVPLILKAIRGLLPAGPRLFGDDAGLDSRRVEVLAQEIIQEKLFRRVHEEVPYGCAVLVETADREGGVVRIEATVLVDRESYKPIVIGEKGGNLKRIGTEARRELEQALGGKVVLKTWVKVERNWRDREGLLKELGYVGSVMSGGGQAK